jgi:hypothetical protein
MTDDVTALRERIPGYAGHADVAARRLSDQQLRAFAGESLVAFGERVPGVADGALFGPLLLRMEFGDQHVIKAIENERFADPGVAGAIEGADLALVTEVTRTATAAAADADAVLAAIDAALTRRSEILTGLLKG